MRAAVERLDFAELAIAVSEPVDVAAVLNLCEVARRRGRPVAITTTAENVTREPALLDGADRLNLSVDPWKIVGDAAAIRARVEEVSVLAKRRRSALEVIAIATLSTPAFAELLIARGDDGLLAALVDTPAVDGVALNALKPPPPFCDRAFWLGALARLRPLLDRALDRRLYLDCYVAARLLGIGGCPARPDLSPTSTGQLAFRACVYAAKADVEIDPQAPETLDAIAAGFSAPAVCPFDTRLD